MPEVLAGYDRHEDSFIADDGRKISIFTSSQVIVFLVLLATLFRLRFAYLIFTYIFFFIVFNLCYLIGISSNVSADVVANDNNYGSNAAAREYYNRQPPIYSSSLLGNANNGGIFGGGGSLFSSFDGSADGEVSDTNSVSSVFSNPRGWLRNKFAGGSRLSGMSSSGIGIGGFGEGN